MHSDKFMKERTCVITGASSGIGLETAFALGKLGARLVLLGRHPGRCRRAAGRLEKVLGRKPLAFLTADFSRFEEVRAAGERVLELCDRIHVLIHNAGAYYPRGRRAENGLEMHLALNHLGPFLFNQLLLDRVVASAPARVVVVASGVHKQGRLDPERLGSNPECRGLAAYAASKLANILWTRELAQRLAGTGVTANALHPGYVDTLLGRDGGRLRFWARRLLKGTGLPVAEGARTVIWLASAPEVQGLTGKYFEKQQEIEPAPQALDGAAGRKLWEASLKLTGLNK